MHREIKNSLSKNTKKVYKKYWYAFVHFINDRYNFALNYVNSQHIAEYVIYLILYKKLTIHSIRPTLSAIAFYSKLKFGIDPTKSYTISKLLKKYTKEQKNTTIRKPITHKLLKVLINHLHTLPISLYLRTTYSLLYAFMYHAALRISEVCHTATPEHILQYRYVTYSKRKSTIKLKLLTYKHCKNTPVTLGIPCTKSLERLYNNYIHLRSSNPGPFFCNRNLNPIKRSAISKLLKKTIKNVKL